MFTLPGYVGTLSLVYLALTATAAAALAVES